MSEKLGTLIGVNNVLTLSATRVPPGPDPGSTPGLRERLRVHAVRALEGRESYIHDAIVMGRRVRLFSNSHHLADFWRDGWPGEADWLRKTGQAVLHNPVLSIYAMIGVENEPPATHSSPSTGEAFLFNTSYYGDLRALTMETLGRLPGEHGVRLVHGAAAEVRGRGVLILYPKEVVHPTPTWGLMEIEGTRFLADGWVALDAAGRLWPVENKVYARTSFVEHYPEYAARLLAAKLENVPDPTPELLERGAAGAQAIVEAALRGDSLGVLKGLPPEKAREVVLRLTASPDARALVDPVALFGRSRMALGPAAPAAVFGLKALSEEPLRPAKLDNFPCPGYEVHVGAVKGHPRELARLIARAAAS